MKKTIAILIALLMTMTIVPFSYGTTVEENVQELQPQAPVIKTVTGVKAQLITKSSIKISWKRQSGVDGYRVYRYDSKEGKYVRIKTLGKTSSSYVNKKLKTGKNYSYKVAAYKKVDGKYTVGPMSTKVTMYAPKKLTTKHKSFSTTNAAKVTRTAKSKINAQYVYGAKGPNSFDCSGFVKYAYKKSGIKPSGLPGGSSRNMYQSMKKYSIGKDISKAQPGDMVFYSYSGSPSGINHVAIYYSHDKVIHAMNPRKDVKITKVRYGQQRVTGIVRLPNM